MSLEITLMAFFILKLLIGQLIFRFNFDYSPKSGLFLWWTNPITKKRGYKQLF